MTREEPRTGRQAQVKHVLANPKPGHLRCPWIYINIVCRRGVIRFADWNYSHTFALLYERKFLDMEVLAAYIIPVHALRSGQNTLEYSVDWRFFTHFQGSPVQQGKFDIQVVFDKLEDHWHLHFWISGHMDTDCDRCLAPITLPVSGTFELYVKFEGREQADPGDEIVYVQRETTEFGIAPYIYEFIVLSLPVTRTYACTDERQPPCDQEMLKRLAEPSDELEGSPVWDVLKALRTGS